MTCNKGPWQESRCRHCCGVVCALIIRIPEPTLFSTDNFYIDFSQSFNHKKAESLLRSAKNKSSFVKNGFRLILILITTSIPKCTK